MTPDSCAADPQAAIPRSVLRTCCLPGYARSRCQRAAGAEADAVRVSVKSDTAAGIAVAWALERDHRPLEVGIADGANPRTESVALDAQIRACCAAYRDFKRGAGARLPRP